MQTTTITPPAKALCCRVKVNGTIYTGLFDCTFDAVIHAQSLFGHNARISVRVAA